MIAKFTFRYGFEPTPGQVEAFNKVITPALTFGDDGKVKSWELYEGELESVLPLLDANETIQVAGIGDPRPLLELRDQLLMRLGDIEARMRTSTPDSYVNSKVEVHVPGAALLRIDEVELLEDGCTDELNLRLENGWRIVAVCPQPDQRRPDYIMGRQKP